MLIDHAVESNAKQQGKNNAHRVLNPAKESNIKLPLRKTVG